MNDRISLEQFEDLKKSLKDEGTLAFKISGGSMLPLIKPGSLVEIKPIEQIEKFDIVIFFFRERLYCHYVWHKNSINSNTFVTRGLNSGEDVPVATNLALGKVTNFKIGFFKRLRLNLEAIRKSR